MDRDKLIKKVQTQIPDFAEMVESLDNADLDKNLLIYIKHTQETKIAQESDEELKNAKNLAKELGAPYAEALKMLNLKVQYLHLLLKERN